MTPPAGFLGTTPTLAAEVLETDPAGGVRRFRVRLAEPIDPERTRFLVPREGRLVHVPPPAIGATAEIPPIAVANPFEPK
jgi:hypothetical protein